MILRELRELAGMTQEALGEKVGVTRQTIAAWESGERTPALEQLGRLARVLGVSLDLFLKPEEGLEPVLLFRADVPSAISQDLKIILTRKVEDYAFIEQIVGAEPVLPESRKAQEQALAAIDTHAERIRDWLGVENGPLGDVLALLEDRGIKIIQCPLPLQISGFSAYTEELGGVIIVNTEHATERQYFTAIHELVHLIYHRTEYRKPVALPAKGKDPREKFADALAGAVLIPRSVIEEELGFYRNKWIPEPVLDYMKRRYYVSMKTVLFRAEQTGLISPKQRGQQMSKLILKYGKVDEGAPLEKPKMPSRLERLVYQALADEKITTSRAAEILGRPLIEVRTKLSEWCDEEAVA
jgi:Zn-dependent peptidase ImmA (M78 family)/transcriptional regulator with XRE-family HTH domain